MEKKVLLRVLCSVIFVMTVFFASFTNTAFAEDQYLDDYRSDTGIGVRPAPTFNDDTLGKNVTSQATDFQAEEKSFNASTGDTFTEYQPNNYSFVYVTYLATFPNEDLSLKKGDYFQLKLDKGVRPDGVVDRNVAKGPSIYDYYSDSSDPIGTTHYDPATNIMTFTFNEYIESHKNVTVYVETADAVDHDKITDEGSYTFTDNFAGNDFSYTYPIKFNTNVNGDFDTPVHADNIITDVNPETNTFTLHEVVRTKDTTHPIVMRYANSKLNYDYSNVKLKIFEIPEGDTLPASLGFDESKYQDIADQFTTEKVGNDLKITQNENATSNSGRFMVILEDKYIPENGIMNTLVIDEINHETGARGKSAGATNFIQEGALIAYAKGEYSEPVKNKLNRAISIKKVNEDGEPLTHAEFTVYDESGQNVDTIVTGQDGIGYSKLLEVGSYTVKETKAPEDYALDKTPISIDLEQKDSQIVKKTVTDHRAKTSVSVEKTWIGKAGESATVHLFSGEKEIASHKLTAEEN